MKLDLRFTQRSPHAVSSDLVQGWSRYPGLGSTDAAVLDPHRLAQVGKLSPLSRCLGWGQNSTPILGYLACAPHLSLYPAPELDWAGFSWLKQAVGQSTLSWVAGDPCPAPVPLLVGSMSYNPICPAP
ncbi:hypothetical protein DSO57_1007485 [Entomophthora muscae]|uniref:Uncharacterized protein n=1 Tax=Entomophthora muscae TaxID=34485 RepID=A0ACC2TI29_9FUNG|nr:hypothetical protein DSO57_1007485 [Entomophthora muscae]